jgi:hypothetical protein
LSRAEEFLFPVEKCRWNSVVIDLQRIERIVWNLQTLFLKSPRHTQNV